tara:strand:+ start:395 stop:592 length:198 start_codon:yes stop_codon:yes gene_type:complete
MGKVNELSLHLEEMEHQVDCHIDSQIKEKQLNDKLNDKNSSPRPGESLHKYILRVNWPYGPPKDD